MLNIIIDTDPGVDDAQAIAYALAHPELNVLGLTTVFGNASIDITTRNALQVLALLNHPNVPVARGAEQPLLQSRFPSPDFVHGQDAMGNINLAPPESLPVELDAADFILHHAEQQQGELCLVAIGPLTNLATALERDATLASNVKKVVVMGGTVLEPGNVSPVAEANFIGDPQAADAVVSAGWDLTVVGLDVTHKTVLTKDDLETLKIKCGSAGEFLCRSGEFYFDFYRTARSNSNTTGLNNSDAWAPMHDASALIQLTNPDYFQTIQGSARVASEGPALGQLVLDRMGHDYFLPYWKNQPEINVAMTVDAQRVHHVFMQTLLTGMGA